VQLNYHRSGHGEPLVLIHGIGSRWQMWEPVLERLRAERDVIAIDLPGFGGSPMPPPGTPAGPESLTTLVQEFLEELDVQRPHVAGNSLGGLVALELARRGAVRSANGISPAGFANRPETMMARGSLRLMIRLARWMAPRANGILRTPTARRLALGQVVARPERIPPAHAADDLRALAGAPWFDLTLPTLRANHFGDGPEIAVPVTIAWGDKDRLLLPRQAQRAARLIPGARIVPLPGCGHVPTFDDPELVARVVLEGSAS
jgi:pimeloyl-ACP methyl ester carboxylesterase